MDMTTYIRRPFEVTAVEITADNIAEIAAITGELKHDDQDTPYILVNRQIVPFVKRASIGWWLTRMNDEYRCYDPGLFGKMFASIDSEEGYYFVKMLEAKELVTSSLAAEAQDGIRQGMADAEAGNVQPANEVLEELGLTAEDTKIDTPARSDEDIAQDAEPVENQPGGSPLD